MYCPECGNDADKAKFCPECGANLAGVKDALDGKPAAKPAKSTGPAKQGDKAAAKPASAGGPARLSPAVIWGGFGALAVVVIVVVVMISGGFGGDSGGGDTASASNGPVEGVTADTSGSYGDLVARANELYDQGIKQFDSGNMQQGAEYFSAAAKVYAAAWQQQSTEPGVGTDYASSLFYSGDFNGAIRQAEAVLAGNPDFQNAYLTKGNAFAHRGRSVQQEGDDKAAQADFKQAKLAYTKVIALDPGSESAKTAKAMMATLPQ
jgi:hypothetical protein